MFTGCPACRAQGAPVNLSVKLDLSPLEGMPLKGLAFQNSRVCQLASLAKMPLEWLNCSHTRVADLSPLKGMNLSALYFDSTQVADLSPLKGIPLRSLHFRGYRLQPNRDGAILRFLDQV